MSIHAVHVGQLSGLGLGLGEGGGGGVEGLNDATAATSPTTSATSNSITTPTPTFTSTTTSSSTNTTAVSDENVIDNINNNNSSNSSFPRSDRTIYISDWDNDNASPTIPNKSRSRSSSSSSSSSYGEELRKLHQSHQHNNNNNNNNNNQQQHQHHHHQQQNLSSSTSGSPKMTSRRGLSEMLPVLPVKHTNSDNNDDDNDNTKYNNNNSVNASSNNDDNNSSNSNSLIRVSPIKLSGSTNNCSLDDENDLLRKKVAALESELLLKSKCGSRSLKWLDGADVQIEENRRQEIIANQAIVEHDARIIEKLTSQCTRFQEKLDLNELLIAGYASRMEELNGAIRHLESIVKNKDGEIKALSAQILKLVSTSTAADLLSSLHVDTDNSDDISQVFKHSLNFPLPEDNVNEESRIKTSRSFLDNIIETTHHTSPEKEKHTNKNYNSSNNNSNNMNSSNASPSTNRVEINDFLQFGYDAQLDSLRSENQRLRDSLEAERVRFRYLEADLCTRVEKAEEIVMLEAHDIARLEGELSKVSEDKAKLKSLVGSLKQKIADLMSELDLLNNNSNNNNNNNNNTRMKRSMITPIRNVNNCNTNISKVIHTGTAESEDRYRFFDSYVGDGNSRLHNASNISLLGNPTMSLTNYLSGPADNQDGRNVKNSIKNGSSSSSPGQHDCNDVDKVVRKYKAREEELMLALQIVVNRCKELENNDGIGKV